MTIPERAALAAVAAFALAVATVEPAWACTTCNSDVAQAVRARFFDSNMLANAAAVLAPFPLFAAALILVSARNQSRGARKHG